MAPRVLLTATHEAALEVVSLEGSQAIRAGPELGSTHLFMQGESQPPLYPYLASLIPGGCGVSSKTSR